MALFFDIDLIKKESKDDTDRFIKIFEILALGKDSVSSEFIKSVRFSRLRKGSSFILNIRPLLSNNHVDKAYIVQYILLASLRDYYMYKTYRIKYLDTTYYPDLNMDVIKSNPLLDIKERNIYFKYEE